MSFDANGGAGAMDSIRLDSLLTVPECSLTPPEGKVFSKWNTKSDGTGKDFAVGDAISPYGDVLLFAIWDVRTYTVIYDTQGGSPVPAVGGFSISSDHLVSVPAPSKEGFVFAGWYTSPDTATRKAVSNTNTLSEFISDSEQDSITFYAAWEKIRYTVVYDAGGGTPARQSKTGLDGDSKDFMTGITTPVRDGYTFLGWFTASSGETARQISSSNVVNYPDLRPNGR